MADHDHRGKFLPGNKISKLGGRPKQYEGDRKEIRKEILKCAHSLSQPLSTLEEEITNPNATRLEYLTAYAVSKKNYKFIQWLLEMAVGRPQQTQDENIIDITNGRPHEADTNKELHDKLKLIYEKKPK